MYTTYGSTIRCPECFSNDIWYNFVNPVFYCASCHLDFCEHEGAD